MKTKNWVANMFVAILLTALFAVTAWSQVGSSGVNGSVTDPQGNVVAGATVRLISDTANVRTVVTGNNGTYSFPTIKPGAYRIEVEMGGFKKSTISNVKALVDNSTVINIVLEIGGLTETVNVDAAGLESIVNTTDGSLGNNFVSRQILQLPLLGRNVANLLSLQPGVTPDGSVAGGRSDQANITLDGIDVNNQQNASAFSPVIRVNPDSVDEFRVTTANPDASKGRSSGAQISLITKSGSNEFHGALYEYHRNTVTTANDWFNNATGVARPNLIRNLFGGRVGGPIVKDRLFFFYNYEGMRESKSSSVARTVPSASLAAGNIQFVDNTGQSWTIGTPAINTFTLNGVPVVDVNNQVPALFSSAVSRYPINDSTLGDGRNSGGFRFNAPVPVEQNAHTARIDWTVTSDQKHQVSFRGNYQQDVTGAAPYFPDTPSTSQWSHPLGYSATYTWLVNSNMTNRFSYGVTRMAFSNQGDSTDPTITFRYIYQPSNFTRAFERVNPTTNITDDFTWIKGNHTFQFGTNIRLIRNHRTNYASSYDNATTNPSAYATNIARTAINQYITAQTGSTRSVASSWSTPVQGALVALLGRLNGYGANFNFDINGNLLPENTGVTRQFNTEEYDVYFQDSWKIRPNITLTAGLRYGISVPVYETSGYETVPNIVLSDYLATTVRMMNQGINYQEPLSVRLAGKANGLDSIYPMDTNNYQPRIALAWSPEFTSGFWSKVFGKESESVFRGGFAMTNDYFGQQLATNWDGSNTLGFGSSDDINVNTYNITDNLGPAYTGPSMSIRNLPNITIPGQLTFPQTAPFQDPGSGKIETSLDQNLVSPVNYSWNISYGRRLPGKIWIDVAYVGRYARNLLVGRDAMMLRDIRDPRSGVSWNEATTMLDRQLQAGVSAANITPIAFFDNLWAPGSLSGIFGCPASVPVNCTNTQVVYYAQPAFAGDWTYLMNYLDYYTPNVYFFQQQYDSLSAFSTVGSSDYHGMTVSIRQRLADLTWDFNYTYSRSIDNASGLQTGGLFGSTFILDAFHLDNSRTVSDFDLPQMINFNAVWDLPFGRGKRYGGSMNKWADAFVGGWQVSSIFRWDSGYPFTGYFDGTGWQTNWNIRSWVTGTGTPITSGTFFNSAANSCTSGCSLPNLFPDPDAAYASFRTPHPGETGTRNPFRMPGAINLDMGLAKSFNLPKEGQKITFRWDVFNVTNTPVFAGQSTFLVNYTGSSATSNFGRFTGTANNARIMQFALRFDF